MISGLMTISGSMSGGRIARIRARRHDEGRRFRDMRRGDPAAIGILERRQHGRDEGPDPIRGGEIRRPCRRPEEGVPELRDLPEHGHALRGLRGSRPGGPSTTDRAARLTTMIVPQSYTGGGFAASDRLDRDGGGAEFREI
jgi:hypothetical protein